MGKISNGLKVRLFIIFLLSHASLYLFLTLEDSSLNHSASPEFEQRESYITISIQAELKTSFHIYKPVMISNANRSFIIPYAILLQELNSENNDFSPQLEIKKSKTFNVYIHEDYADQLLKAKRLQILPLTKKITTIQKGREYEIRY